MQLHRTLSKEIQIFEGEASHSVEVNAPSITILWEGIMEKNQRIPKLEEEEGESQEKKVQA